MQTERESTNRIISNMAMVPNLDDIKKELREAKNLNIHTNIKKTTKSRERINNLDQKIINKNIESLTGSKISPQNYNKDYYELDGRKSKICHTSSKTSIRHIPPTCNTQAHQSFAPKLQNKKYADSLLQKVISHHNNNNINNPDPKTKNILQEMHLQDYVTLNEGTGGKISKSKSCLRLSSIDQRKDIWKKNIKNKNNSKGNQHQSKLSNKLSEEVIHYRVNTPKRVNMHESVSLETINKPPLRPFSEIFKINNYNSQHLNSKINEENNIQYAHLHLYTRKYSKGHMGQNKKTRNQEMLIKESYNTEKQDHNSPNILLFSFDQLPNSNPDLKLDIQNKKLILESEPFGSRNKYNIRKHLTDNHIYLPNIADKNKNIQSSMNNIYNDQYNSNRAPNTNIFPANYILIPENSTINIEQNNSKCNSNLPNTNIPKEEMKGNSLKKSNSIYNAKKLQLHNKEKANTARIHENSANKPMSHRVETKRDHQPPKVSTNLSSLINNTNISKNNMEVNESLLNKMKNIKHIRSKENTDREQKYAVKVEHQSLAFQNKYFMFKKPLPKFQVSNAKSDINTSFEIPKKKNSNFIEISGNMKPIRIKDSNQVEGSQVSVEISKLVRDEFMKGTNNMENLSITPLNNQLPHKPEQENRKSIVDSKKVEEIRKYIHDKLPKIQGNPSPLKNTIIDRNKNKHIVDRKRKIEKVNKRANKVLINIEDQIVNEMDNNLFGKDAICSWEQNATDFSDYDDEFENDL